MFGCQQRPEQRGGVSGPLEAITHLHPGRGQPRGSFSGCSFLETAPKIRGSRSKASEGTQGNARRQTIMRIRSVGLTFIVSLTAGASLGWAQGLCGTVCPNLTGSGHCFPAVGAGSGSVGDACLNVLFTWPDYPNPTP